MPRVSRERTKYHTTKAAPAAALPAGSTPAAGHGFFASVSAALTKPAEKEVDIVSAPVPLFAAPAANTDADGEDNETSAAGRKTKKGKRVDRHQKWMEKMQAARNVDRKHKQRKGRSTNKSALIRGMGGLEESLREIQADQLAKDLFSPEKKAKKAADSSGSSSGLLQQGPKSLKAKHKAAIKEEKRFAQILGHPAFKADPLATIRQHLANSLNQQQQQ
ncbi:hypothetical protein FBU59_004920 [Linderina macrospora]|uniref:Uncharacterized protein n=1 Tax=Linderina macrospora TaxID=4868 RepID=A0ACC1J4B5_9FUNG|nr:hypothetical protein FBU59_004920 [Linderina macrospora]